MAFVSEASPLTPARRRAQELAAGGDLAGARDLLEKAVELGRMNLAEDDPDVLVTAYQLARVYQRLDDYSAARRVLEESYAAGQWRLGDHDPLMVEISHDIGVVAEELGNRHEARKAFTRVAEYGPAALGAGHQAVVRAQAYLGHAPDSVRAPAPTTASGAVPEVAQPRLTLITPVPSSPPFPEAAEPTSVRPAVRPGLVEPPPAVAPIWTPAPRRSPEGVDEPTIAQPTITPRGDSGRPAASGSRDYGPPPVRSTPAGQPPGPSMSPFAQRVARSETERDEGTALLPAQRVPDQRVPDQRVPDQRVPDQRLPDQRLPDQRLPDQRLPDQRVLDQQAPDQWLPRAVQPGYDVSGGAVVPSAGFVSPGEVDPSRGLTPGGHLSGAVQYGPAGSGPVAGPGHAPGSGQPGAVAGVVVGGDGAYKKRGVSVFAAVAAVLASIIAVAALVFVLANRGEDNRHATASDVPTLAGAPPTGVQLRDRGAEIEVTWKDPTAGTVSFMVVMAHPGEELKPMATLGPGQTSYRAGGLSTRLNYCFAVVAVYRANQFAPSPQSCTSRAGLGSGSSTGK